MDNIKTKVNKVVVGPYDCDCAYVTIDKRIVQICFDRKDKIIQYEGKDVILSKANGIYSIVSTVADQKK